MLMLSVWVSTCCGCYGFRWRKDANGCFQISLFSRRKRHGHFGRSIQKKLVNNIFCRWVPPYSSAGHHRIAGTAHGDYLWPWSMGPPQRRLRRTSVVLMWQRSCGRSSRATLPARALGPSLVYTCHGARRSSAGWPWTRDRVRRVGSGSRGTRCWACALLCHSHGKKRLRRLHRQGGCGVSLMDVQESEPVWRLKGTSYDLACRHCWRSGDCSVSGGQKKRMIRAAQVTRTTWHKRQRIDWGPNELEFAGYIPPHDLGSRLIVAWCECGTDELLCSYFFCAR